MLSPVLSRCFRLFILEKFME